jgi:protein TonB
MESNEQLNWNDGSFHNEVPGRELSGPSRFLHHDDRRPGTQQARMTSDTPATTPTAASSSPELPPASPAVPPAGPPHETTLRGDDEPHASTGLFLFEQRKKRISGALGVSVAAHALVILAIILIMTYAPLRSADVAPQPTVLPEGIVWLAQPGPGGGGGGGGNQMKEPPRKAELPGKDKLTVPVMKTPTLTPPEKPKPQEPTQELTIPVKTESAGATPLPGTLVSNQAALTTSQGSGIGGGAGTGTGTGIGEGRGSGLGAGEGGGTGGGYYQPGNGVLSPDVIFEKKPNYTPDAMRGRIQGTAWVAAVVLSDGTVGEAHIVRSLDSVFGLDEEAIKAVKQWRFRPGTRFGKPVPVQVVIEVSFTMR